MRLVTEITVEEVIEILKGFNSEQVVIQKLNEVLQNQGAIMSLQEDLAAALLAIKTATDEQGVVLAKDSITLQEISDDFDAFIAAAGQPGGITPELLTAAQQSADRAQQISVAMKAHSDFATSIAAKGTTDPVPLPVPLSATA